MKNNLIVVIGYPKSGNTWMVRLLADVLKYKVLATGNVEKDDIASDVNNQLTALSDDYLITKQHELPGKLSPQAACCVYMIRDVRDVLTSYYFWHHPLQSTSFDVNSFNNFVREHLMGKMGKLNYGSWQYHIKAWYDNYAGLSAKMPVIFVKYEDMLYNAYEQIKKTITKLGFSAPPSQIKVATYRQSFEQKKVYYNNLPEGTKLPGGTDANLLFLRKGTAGDWRNWFDNETKSIVKQYAGHTLIKLGYAKDDGW